MTSTLRHHLGLCALVLIALAGCRTPSPQAGLTPDLAANKLDPGTNRAPQTQAPLGSPGADEADTDADEAVAEARGAEQNLADQSLAADGDQADHRLSARAGDSLHAAVKGISQGAVLLEFLGPDGRLLASSDSSPVAQRNSLSATATQDGEQLLRVSSAAGAPALSYDLRLWVEVAAEGEGDAAGDDAADDVAGGDSAAATPSETDGSGAGGDPAAAPAAQPKRIRFQAGSTGGVVKGDMAAAGEQQRYLLEAGQGQVMVVTLTSEPVGAVDLMLFSPDERPLRPLATDGGSDDAGDTALRFPLPQDGDYSLSLHANEAATWTLEILLEAGGQSGIGGAGGLAVGSAPTRLIFGPGNQATRVLGLLSAGTPQRFVLRGEAGQTLALSLEAAAGPQVYVEDPRGQVLAAGRASAPLTVPLPASQDYWVTVLAPPSSEATQIAVNFGLQ